MRRSPTARATRAAIILGARMLALTHHDLGDLKRARQYVASVLSQAPHLAPESGNDLQVDARVAMLTSSPASNGCRDFPIRPTPRRGRRSTPRCGCIIGFRFATSCFLPEVPFRSGSAISQRLELRLEMLRERTGGNSEFPGFSLFTGNYAAVVRLRQASEAEALTAAYIEPRMQEFSKAAALGQMTRHASIALPFPDDIPCDAPWSLPEVLRVDAELLLWRGEPRRRSRPRRRNCSARSNSRVNRPPFLGSSERP